jgi:hypothetical protein
MIYTIFIGASALISDELHKINKGRQDVKVISPAMKGNNTGLNSESIRFAFESFVKIMQNEEISQEKSRFLVLSFPSSNPDIVNNLLSTFGAAAWIEFISNDNCHKITKLRTEVEVTIEKLRPRLHVISHEVYGRRKSSPFCLPLKNFVSLISFELKRRWYHCSDVEFSQRIYKFRRDFHLLQHNDSKSFVDDRGLIFSPAADTVCHGIAHPTGRTHKTFIRGKFRFGVSLFPGFHYEVSDKKGRNLRIILKDSESGERQMRSERRKYINIHPNDVLLPQK